MSKEANTVIVAIYMNYFANEKQKSIIEKILKQNTIIEEQEKIEKYDVNKIFEKSQMEHNKENLPVDISKTQSSILRKIINKIKSLFKRD